MVKVGPELLLLSCKKCSRCCWQRNKSINALGKNLHHTLCCAPSMSYLSLVPVHCIIKISAPRFLNINILPLEWVDWRFNLKMLLFSDTMLYLGYTYYTRWIRLSSVIEEGKEGKVSFLVVDVSTSRASLHLLHVQHN